MRRDMEKMKEAKLQEQLVEAQENIDEVMGDYSQPNILPYNPTAEVSFNQAHNPDTFYAYAYGASLYNYDSMYDIWTVYEEKGYSHPG
jgi:hypothetical protein